MATFFIQGGEVSKAEPLLRQLIAPGVSENMRRWARRSLALALVASGDFRKSSESIALLDENLRERPGSPEDLRARSLINATRPGGRRQSIKDLEASFARRPTPNEEFLLARLYDMEGEWLKAREILEGILSRESGRSPTPMIYFVRRLLDQEDYTSASLWLSRLEALEGKEKTLSSIGLRARLDAKQGREQDAVARLKEFAKSRIDAKGNPRDVGRVGLLLAALKQFDEAERILREYVHIASPKDPAAVLVLVDFLADRNRVSEALQVCASVASQVGPEVTARFAVAAVRRGKATADDFSQAESMILDAQRAKPQSIDLQLSLADFRDAQGRYDEAERLYQEVLTRDSRNALALNNLAWLRSFHDRNGEEALRLINRAIEQMGPMPDLLDTRGMILIGLGRFQEAQQDLSHSATQEPRATSYFHLALAQHRAGLLREARNTLLQALEEEKESQRNLRSDLHALERSTFDELLSLLKE
jgi:tetratricopeptide (TPR) repeat protein